MTQIKKSIPLLNPSAQILWNSCLSSDDRVLITGASGWFGQTAARMMINSHAEALLLASSSREIKSLENTLYVNSFDYSLIKNFQPTVVIDCAFITRERIDEFGLEAYITANEELQKHLVSVVSMPSVERYVSFSSGAAIHPVDASNENIEQNPYGFLKRKAEIELQLLSSDLNTNGVIARAWSVSGGLVTKPTSFALSDFIAQAHRGELLIRASKPVYRRYGSVEDLLALALYKTRESTFSILNSEGTLVEMGELARKVVEEVNPSALITRVKPTADKEDLYYASSHEWEELEQQLPFSARGITDQIRATYQGMKMGRYL